MLWPWPMWSLLGKMLFQVHWTLKSFCGPALGKRPIQCKRSQSWGRVGNKRKMISEVVFFKEFQWKFASYGLWKRNSQLSEKLRIGCQHSGQGANSFGVKDSKCQCQESRHLDWKHLGAHEIFIFRFLVLDFSTKGFVAAACSPHFLSLHVRDSLKTFNNQHIDMFPARMPQRSLVFCEGEGVLWCSRHRWLRIGQKSLGYLRLEVIMVICRGHFRKKFLPGNIQYTESRAEFQWIGQWAMTALRCGSQVCRGAAAHVEAAHGRRLAWESHSALLVRGATGSQDLYGFVP